SGGTPPRDRHPQGHWLADRRGSAAKSHRELPDCDRRCGACGDPRLCLASRPERLLDREHLSQRRGPHAGLPHPVPAGGSSRAPGVPDRADRGDERQPVFDVANGDRAAAGGAAVTTTIAQAVEARGLTKTYRGGSGREVRAVHEVSLTVPAGAFVLLAGPSGSGKTTLLALLGGLERPTAGQVLFGDRDMGRW